MGKKLDQFGITAAAIHGNKRQGARIKALADFKQNKIRVLVATDIAARGIDISNLPHVISFELPNVPEDYVYRIGRKGRAGAGGEAISLVSADEVEFLADIEEGFVQVPITMLNAPKNRNHAIWTCFLRWVSLTPLSRENSFIEKNNWDRDPAAL